MSGIEVPLTEELRAAVLGQPLPSQAHKQVGDLAGSLTSGGSANWPCMGWAVRYVLKDPAADDQWRRYFDACKTCWMGDELLSYIYGRMHMLSVAAVAAAARARGDAPLLLGASIWLQLWWGLSMLAESADGRIELPGMRSAGHAPLPGWREWLLSIARGDAPSRARAEEWGRAAGLGMKQQWEWGTALALEGPLKLSYQPLAGKSLVDVAAALPAWGLITPLHIYRTAAGVVVSWLENNANGNTPPHMWRGQIAGVETCAPTDGGTRVREQFDHASVILDGQALTYKSSLYPGQVLNLPSGDAQHLVLGIVAAAAPIAQPPAPTAISSTTDRGSRSPVAKPKESSTTMEPITTSSVPVAAPVTDNLFRSIPVWLRVGLSAAQIIFRDRNGAVARASWTPADNQDTFGVPIGGADSPVEGTLVGERYSRQLLQQVIRAGGLPLPPNYAVTDRDDDLMKLVAIGNLPAWDALVVPAANKVGVTVDPGPVAPNSSPGAAGVPGAAPVQVQGGGAVGALGTGPGDGDLISHPDAAPLVGASAPLPVVPLPTTTDGLVAIAQTVAPDHAEAQVTLFGRQYKLSLDALA